jgi:hypothetical protein
LIWQIKATAAFRSGRADAAADHGEVLGAGSIGSPSMPRRDQRPTECARSLDLVKKAEQGLVQPFFA